MDRADVRRIFQMFDRNSDGRITHEELHESLERLGLFTPEDELREMVSKVDVNGDGSVDIDEFASLYQTLIDDKEVLEDDMMDAFNVFDLNGDGYITVDELKSVLKALGVKQGTSAEDCKKMISNVDADGDGMVNYVEFKQMMNGGHSLC